MPHINILGTFIVVIIGYLIGSISPAIIISKKRFATDVRDYYSRNAGATNATRVMGKKWGILILLFDGFKPVIVVLVAWSLTFINIQNSDYSLMFKNAYIYFAGLSAIIGHCFPIWFQFRGGKGAASTLGLLLVINPIYCLIAIATWWILLFIFKITSLSSILMIIIPFILSFIRPFPLTAYLHYHDLNYYVISIIIGIDWLLVIFQHRSNIKRIWQGTERKGSFLSKKSNK